MEGVEFESQTHLEQNRVQSDHLQEDQQSWVHPNSVLDVEIPWMNYYLAGYCKTVLPLRKKVKETACMCHQWHCPGGMSELQQSWARAGIGEYGWGRQVTELPGCEVVQWGIGYAVQVMMWFAPPVSPKCVGMWIMIHNLSMWMNGWV